MKALETRARTLTLDEAGLEDLRTIAQRKAGKGEALRRMLQLAELSQHDLADCIGVQRATVTSWVSESRWPKDQDLRKALVALGISRQVLIREWQVTHQDDIQLMQRLKSDLDFVFEPIDRFITIADSLEEEIFIRQGFKAKEDTRAADFFIARADAYREVKRKQSVDTARSINTSQSSWASGNSVYAKPSSTTEEQPQSTDDIAFAQAQALAGIQ